MNIRLLNSIETYSLIPNNQNGFRESKETLHCIYTLINIIQNSKETNKDLHVIYVDFCKAFDSVQYWALAAILKAFNFGDTFVNSLMAVYVVMFSQVLVLLKTFQYKQVFVKEIFSHLHCLLSSLPH